MQHTNEAQQLLNVSEVADLIGAPVRSVQRWVQSGALPATKLPGRTGSYVIARSDAEAFGAARTPKVPA